MPTQKGSPRRNASSAEQSRDQKVWSDTKSNVFDDSTDEDKYLEGTGQKEAMKYLKGKLLLLGSKTLGTNVLELQFVLCWQTMIKT